MGTLIHKVLLITQLFCIVHNIIVNCYYILFAYLYNNALNTTYNLTYNTICII